MLDTAQIFRDDTASALRVGLVNNMPDAALRRTEMQFRALLEDAAQGRAVSLTATSFGSVPRDPQSARYIADYYIPAQQFRSLPLDLVVITGAEPKTARLDHETYWTDLTALFGWMDEHDIPGLFSCLAAHAAVLHWNGLERTPLATKRFGVFTHSALNSHPLTRGMPASHKLPHSRWNAVAGAALERHGYTILTETAEGDVGAFVRRNGRPDLFFQGHPEYDADSLLREYRRDIRRFLLGQRPTYPEPPHSYLPPKALHDFVAFASAASGDLSGTDRDSIPICRIDLPRDWWPAGVRLVANWLDAVTTRKAHPSLAAAST